MKLCVASAAGFRRDIPIPTPLPSPPGEAPYACLLIPLVGERSVVGTPSFFTTPLVFASKDLLSKINQEKAVAA